MEQLSAAVSLMRTMKSLEVRSLWRSSSRLGLVIITITAASCFVRGQITRNPPPPRDQGKQEISVGQIASTLTPEMTKVVGETNDMLQRTNSSVRVELTSEITSLAQTLLTFYSDRPNQQFVGLTIFFSVEIKPNGVDLSIKKNIGVGLNFFCDGSQTGNGSVRVELPMSSRPDHTTAFEDIFYRLSEDLRARASVLLARNPVFKGRCSAISFSPPGLKTRAMPTSIDVIPPILTSSIIGAARSREVLQIILQSIKRLPAHEGQDDKIIYQPLESILLEVYANSTSREVGVFTMKEGDVVNLNMLPPLLVDPPLLDRLGLIFNVVQLPSATRTDSASTSYLRKDNYVPGVHTSTIDKLDPSRLNHFGNSRPAYEITYSISYANGNASKQSSGSRE